MSALAPNLFQRRYDDLLQIGRSRLPGLTPDWTDHNAHDPGITLMELLAWVAEAQLYALSHTRRDERTAYAALMGIAPHGARPASGLIWPEADDPADITQAIRSPMVINADADVRIAGTDDPLFHPSHRLLWIPARIAELESRLADGTLTDHRMANRRGGPAFLPFGAGDGRGAVFRMSLEATGGAPLMETGRPKDARLVIGVRVEGGSSAVSAVCRGAFEVALVTEAGRFSLPVIDDGTAGMLRTGAIVLDVSGVPGEPATAVLEFRAPDGVDRAPRLLRIQPNVLPVVQRLAVEERHDANGLPDQQFDLETPGLTFEPGTAPVAIEIAGRDGEQIWAPCDRLADCGPEDRVFMLDPVAARILFGNGINGAIPPAEAVITARYATCDGAGGNFAANRQWMVRGVAGLFGVNADPFTGGADASSFAEQRRRARSMLLSDHALVSAADFEAAARALPGLDVGRAWMIPPSARDVATGTMRLVAMRSRADKREPATAPETARWLEAIQRALSPRTPLGSRISVVAPRYVDFSLRARIEPEAQIDPAAVHTAVLAELARRLTLVGAAASAPQRAFGLAVTRRDVAAWMQALPEVRRVRELTLISGAGSAVTEVTLPVHGLPRLDFEHSDMLVERPDGGGLS